MERRLKGEKTRTSNSLRRKAENFHDIHLGDGFLAVIHDGKVDKRNETSDISN